MNLFRHSAAVALVSGVAVASLAAPSAASAHPAAKKATTTSPAAATAGWLARQLAGKHHDHYVDSYTYQGTSYSSPDDGETADGVLSMDAGGVAQAAAKRATKWLETDATNYLTGSGYTRTDYPGQAGKLLLVAHAQGMNGKKFGGVNLVKVIVHSEGAGKGTRKGQYQNPGDTAYGSSVTLQSLAMLGLAVAAPHQGPDHAAKAFLAGQACPNGGFQNNIHSGTKCGREYDDATAFAVQALVASKAKKATIDRAVHWLVRQENSDGGWGDIGTAASDANTTAIVVEALLDANHSATKGEKYLLGQEVRCGGKAANRGAVKFQGGKLDASTDLRAASQAGVALAGQSLNTVDGHGAKSAAPVLFCPSKH